MHCKIFLNCYYGVATWIFPQNRVVRQNPGERNYHIFYALLAGATTEHKSGKICEIYSVQVKNLNPNIHFNLFPLPDLYFLEESPELFHYLSQSGCLKDKSLNDKELFNSVMVSAAELSLSPLCLLVSDLSHCVCS